MRKRFSYLFQCWTKNGQQLTAHISAEWDTRRDAALACKLAYDLTPEEYRTLVSGGGVARTGRDGFTAEINESESMEPETVSASRPNHTIQVSA